MSTRANYTTLTLRLITAAALVVLVAIPGGAADAQPSDKAPLGQKIRADAPLVSETDQFAYALDALGRTKFTDSYAGVIIDEKLRKVVVFTTNPDRGNQLIESPISTSPYTAVYNQVTGNSVVPTLAPDVRTRISTEVRIAKYTATQLNLAREQLWNHIRTTKSADVEVFSIAVPPDGSGLNGTASSPTSARKLVAQWVGTTATQVSAEDVKFQQGMKGTALSRFTDFRPFYSGGTYIMDDPFEFECTSGFGVHHTTYGDSMVTAAHCFGPNRSVYTGGGRTGGAFVGNVGSGIVPYDALAIGTSVVPSVVTNNLGHVFPYGSYARSLQGQKHCQSGYWSDQICDINVDYPNDSWTFDGGVTVHYGASGWRDDHTTSAGRAGDSGGPVYVFRSDNHLESHGIVSGGHWCSPPGAGRRSCSLLHWTLTDDILRTWGVQLITS